MKYVITGATSFIGRELVARLLEMGNEVVAVCRSQSAHRSDIHVGATVITADLESYKDLPRQIPNADVFIHLAWAGTSHAERLCPEIHCKNIKYTLDAIYAAKQMGCQLFTESGSQAEYGIHHQLISEESPCEPVTEYGKAKLAVKEAGFDLSETLGIKYLHLRIFSTYGEKDHDRTLVMSALDKMLAHQPIELTECSQKWNFLYVKDAVQQIAALCNYAVNSTEFQHEVYNIASEDTRELKSFVEEMRSLTRTTAPCLYGAVAVSAPVSLQPDISKMQKAIGRCTFLPFAEGIRKIIAQKETH